MGMYSYVKGLTSKDNEEYKRHKAVLDACVNAGIKDLPKETAEFFGSSYPDPCITEEVLEREIKVIERQDDTRIHYEIKVSEIPSDVDVIRFTNSW